MPFGLTSFEPPLLTLDAGEEAIEIAKLRDVSLDAGDSLRGGEADPAVAAGDERGLFLELTHVVLRHASQVGVAVLGLVVERARSRGQARGPNQAPPATAAALMSPNAATAALRARKT
jgi:hypothetical protein